MRLLNNLQKGFIGWFDKDNNANFLFITAALGWFLASAAQTFGLAKNKELTKEEKKFLVPQEIMDGTANIGMYALVTTKLMDFAENLAKPNKKGKLPINLKNEAGQILDYKDNIKEYAKLGNNLKTGAAILGGVISTCILTPIVRNAFGAYMKKRSDKNNPVANTNTTPVDIYGSRTQPYFTKTYNMQPSRVYQTSGNLKI